MSFDGHCGSISVLELFQSPSEVDVEVTKRIFLRERRLTFASV